MQGEIHQDLVSWRCGWGSYNVAATKCQIDYRLASEERCRASLASLSLLRPSRFT